MTTGDTSDGHAFYTAFYGSHFLTHEADGHAVVTFSTKDGLNMSLSFSSSKDAFFLSWTSVRTACYSLEGRIDVLPLGTTLFTLYRLTAVVENT